MIATDVLLAEMYERHANQAEAWSSDYRDQQARCLRRARDRCHHCGALPDPDGDHTCPCPHRDDECAEHTDPRKDGER
jgi:hypothetical protein